MRLAWCDKAALIWAMIVVGGILFLQQPGGFERSLQAENIGEWGNLLWRVVGIPWLVLRAVDLIAGGPARRRGVFTVHRLR
jgi:hypothetical protein